MARFWISWRTMINLFFWRKKNLFWDTLIMMLMMKGILHFLYENDGDVDEFTSSWTVHIHELYMNCICIQFAQPQFCDIQAWKCDNWHWIFIHVSICVMLTNNYTFCVKGSQRLTYSLRVNLTNNYTVWKESRLPQFIHYHDGSPWKDVPQNWFIHHPRWRKSGWQVQYWSC